MKYYYKPKNQFPYILMTDYKSMAQEDVMHSWLISNIGEYDEQWIILKRTTMTSLDDSWQYPFAFKTEEDAMAFKLRWT